MKVDLLTRKPSGTAGRVATALFVAGGALLLWSGYIHFDLWHSEGYRSLHIIGPLFLVQCIAGLLMALLVLAARRVWAAVLGAGFALSTLAGFLLTVGLDKGLFNFKESWLAPFAKEAFGVEIAATVVLLAAGALCIAGSASPAPTTRSAAVASPS